MLELASSAPVVRVDWMHDVSLERVLDNPPDLTGWDG
jgi:hypothetical protein